jgi:hypothetical protein
MLLNGGLAVALMAYMAFGLRAITALNALIFAALLFGFFNAVGDLIEAERPEREATEEGSAEAPPLYLVERLEARGKGPGRGTGATGPEGLASFLPE